MEGRVVAHWWMCREQTGLLQSKTGSVAPEAGWTSWAGLFWWLCLCWTLGYGRLWIPETWRLPQQTQCCSEWRGGGSVGGLLLKSTVRSHLHSFEHVKLRLFWLHRRASCSALRLYGDTSPSWMRLMTVVSSGNFRSLTDRSPEVQSFV